MKHTAIVATFGLVTLGITGCGGGSSTSPAKTSSPPTSITVRGTITVTGDEDSIDSAPPSPDYVVEGSVTKADGFTCEGTGGYDDMVDGAQVVISSDQGKTLAIGTINGEGEYTGDTYAGVCKMSWSVKGVPTTEKFYNIKIGHRDGPKWTLADLIEGPALTLGD